MTTIYSTNMQRGEGISMFLSYVDTIWDLQCTTWELYGSHMGAVCYVHRSCMVATLMLVLCMVAVQECLPHT